MGCEEKYIPCGIVDEDSGQLHISFGSSYKTSDFIVDTLENWWNGLSSTQQKKTKRLQLKVDNGPESSGIRTQFLKRMVKFSDQIGKPIQLLYYPPYHSKYNPIVGFAFPQGTMLGNFGTTLERHSIEGCRDDAAMGAKYDLEGDSSHHSIEPKVLLKGNLP